MPCFKPLECWQTRSGDPISFVPGQGAHHLAVPCGQCLGCRLDRSQMWAIRCVHEAQLHARNCFITLTYRPADLPPGGSLRKKDFQDFMKRLRASVSHRISFFMCGEYGEGLKRPHFHALLFGHDFDDKSYWKRSADSSPLWRSPTLERLWPHGFSTVGALTGQSAAYCARYVLKKITGDRAAGHYGELVPEFMTCSLRPAIGRGWFTRFASDVWPDDFVVHNGKRARVPRYYDKCLQRLDEGRLLEVKEARKARANSPEAKRESKADRLEVREICLHAKTTVLKRDLEQNG